MVTQPKQTKAHSRPTRDNSATHTRNYSRIHTKPNNSKGVGGRPGNTPTAQGGGGYLDTCRVFESIEARFLKKPGEKIQITLKDLKKIGLSARWLEIAERIGVDAWLEVWEILDRENIDKPPSLRDALRIRVPIYSKLVKYIRNIHIERMAKAGMDLKSIHAALASANIEPVSMQRIGRLKKPNKKTGK